MKKSKFYKRPPFKDRAANFMQSMLFWRGRKKGMIHTRDISFVDVYRCFVPEPGDEYTYLGYAYYTVQNDGSLSATQKMLKDFIEEVDKVARPKWCPRFVLRLLHLFGSDNSIVRVRNRRLHNLEKRLTKGISITDTKWKYDSFRIYGYFTAELDALAKETCKEIEREYNSDKPMFI